MITAGEVENLDCGVRVMSDKGRDLSVCASHRDTPVDPPSEICEAVLEVMMSDLHNI